MTCVTKARGTYRIVLVVNFCVFLKLIFFCSVDAIFDLVHDVEAMFTHP